MTAVASSMPDELGLDKDLPLAFYFIAAPLAMTMAVLSLGIVLPDSSPTATEITRVVLIALWAGAGLALGVGRRGDRLAPIVLGGALIGAIASVADAMSRHDGVNSMLVDGTVRISAGLLVGVFFHFLVGIPDGRLKTQGRRLLVTLMYSASAAVGVGLLGNRIEVRVWPPVALLAAALSIGVYVGNQRYRVSRAIDRRRMQWVGCALTVAIEVLLVVVALNLLVDWPHHTLTIGLAASGVIPISVMAGTHPALIARVDRLLTHTVALAGLTTLVVGIYVVVVVGFGEVSTGNERSLLLLSIGATAVAAVAYNPASERLADVANRLVYGERTAPDETLRTFGQRMTRSIPLDELLLQLVESLRRTMRLRSAEVWTGRRGELELATGVPHRTAPTILLGEKDLPVVARAGISGGTWIDVWLSELVGGRDSACLRVAPLAHAGELLGLIVLERHAEAEAFTESDDLMVTDVARQVGLALHNVQLDSALQASLDQLSEANSELRSSRARIVAAGDAERRRLERNLHDGAQQYLVAMAVKLRLAHDAVEDQSPDSLELLDELRKDMQDAIGELRALAHGIFPPQLMSGGLREAITGAASRSSLPTTVELCTAARFPAEIEAAVYFCVLEALQNAGKHAGPRAEARVAVWEESGELRFSVSDDGAGFDSQDKGATGHGFVNMADRVGAHGGTLTVSSSIGEGVTIGGAIPVAREGDA